MNEEKWDELDIEKLLEQAPKIQDHRSKEDVFAKLQQAGAFEEDSPQEIVVKKKKNSLLLIGITAAIMTLTFSSVYLFSQNNSSNDKSAGVSEISMKDSSNDTSAEVSETSKQDSFYENNARQEESMDEMMKDENAQSSNIRATDNMDLRTSVYPDQLENSTAFHIGLAGGDLGSIPVTIVIPNDRILEDFGTTSPSIVTMYKKYAAVINEQSLGFDEYHPLQGKVEEQGRTILHKLPENHAYDTSSLALSMYDAVLIDTFGGSYNQVAFQKKNGKAITFSQQAEPRKPLSLNNQFSFFLNEQPDGHIYLAPNTRQLFNTVGEALEYMKVEENKLYKTAILQGINYTIEDKGSIVVITFSSSLDLDAYNQQQVMHMIEGMLLTAGSFNKQVQFTNIVQKQWEGFDFTSPLPIPIGANEISLNYLENY